MIDRNKNFTVYLDMDGVIVDFFKGAADFFDVDHQMILDEWPKGKWGDDPLFKRFFGCSGDNFWRAIGFTGFWENLPLTVEGGEILRVLNPYNPVILTVPVQGGADGKRAWIKKRLPEYHRDGRFIMAGNKKHIGGPNKILIDDSDNYIKQWAHSGGIGILVPRPWNSMYWVHDVKGFSIADHIVKSMEYYTGLTRLRSE